MAFSATVRNVTYGGAGAVTLRGDWTGNAGDAAGTFPVYGYVTKAMFQKFDAVDNTFQILPRVEVSVSGGISTITIENQETVTTGRFTIEKIGM